MKFSSISTCITVFCLLIFCASVAFADDAVMLSGFDPLQSGPLTYGQPEKAKLGSQSVDTLFHQAGDPTAGNSNGKVTIIEFFDYRCSHCMAMTPVIDSLMNKNPEVHVIFKEFPIRGKISVYAAKAALAANNQGKFVELHDAMMGQDNLDESKIMSMAKSLGLNTEKLQADMDSVAVEEEIRSTYQVAKELGITGTPTFYISQTGTPAAAYLISGESDISTLQNLIAKLVR